MLFDSQDTFSENVFLELLENVHHGAWWSGWTCQLSTIVQSTLDSTLTTVQLTLNSIGCHNHIDAHTSRPTRQDQQPVFETNNGAHMCASCIAGFTLCASCNPDPVSPDIMGEG